ncbi:hypothetical protein BKA56DRAFT_621401 [Ilyonectria sp. MPI-CAGE-AT-0026]|nr:hypothetical protein BKA56DRAFT_621401 [Ilyonectria sp. MPI-CAGE-AT-0026]
MEMNPLTHSFTPATSPSRVEGIRHSGAGGPTMAWCLVCKPPPKRVERSLGGSLKRITERVIEQVGGQSNSRPRPVVVGGRRSPAGWNPSQQGDALRADTVSPRSYATPIIGKSNDDPHPPSPRAARPKQQALRNVTASALNPPRGPLARHQCRGAGCYFWALEQAEQRC